MSEVVSMLQGDTSIQEFNIKPTIHDYELKLQALRQNHDALYISRLHCIFDSGIKVTLSHDPSLMQIFVRCLNCALPVLVDLVFVACTFDSYIKLSNISGTFSCCTSNYGMWVFFLLDQNFYWLFDFYAHHVRSLRINWLISILYM